MSISCRIPKGDFCNHTINYTTQDACTLDLALILFVLNSAFADWYFRLGSTNAHVNHYQLTNLPWPRLGKVGGTVDKRRCENLESLLQTKSFAQLERECLGLAASKGCDSTVEHAIVGLVKIIEMEERRRGDITRTQRSHLSDDAQKCQDILDKIMMALLGLGDEKHEYIGRRLTEML